MRSCIDAARSVASYRERPDPEELLKAVPGFAERTVLLRSTIRLRAVGGSATKWSWQSQANLEKKDQRKEEAKEGGYEPDFEELWDEYQNEKEQESDPEVPVGEGEQRLVSNTIHDPWPLERAPEGEADRQWPGPTEGGDSEGSDFLRDDEDRIPEPSFGSLADETVESSARQASEEEPDRWQRSEEEPDWGQEPDWQ
jgi:hypothetical protein